LTAQTRLANILETTLESKQSANLFAPELQAAAISAIEQACQPLQTVCEPNSDESDHDEDVSSIHLLRPPSPPAPRAMSSHRQPVHVVPALILDQSSHALSSASTASTNSLLAHRAQHVERLPRADIAAALADGLDKHGGGLTSFHEMWPQFRQYLVLALLSALLFRSNYT
jgi:hypothetical protein